VNWIAADIVRLKDGVLVEHWDVIQDEATREQSKSGLPMFGSTFATYASGRWMPQFTVRHAFQFLAKKPATKCDS
jgi:hypothetical protein